MTTEFFHAYSAAPIDGYRPPPFADGGPEVPDPDARFGHEVPDDEWAPLTLRPGPVWDPATWDLTPRRFIDGRDDGDTATWLRTPGGVRVPVRVGQIGAVAFRRDGRTLRREGSPLVEQIVAFVTDPYPWSEVEGLARDLAALGYRLAPARAPLLRSADDALHVPTVTHDFERMRRAAQSRSNVEMGALEVAVLSLDPSVPTIVDGRLSPRRRGFDVATNAVFGVVKTQRHRYLHDPGLQSLYNLEVGQRTPMFSIRKAGDLPVLSWYARFAGSAAKTPNDGVIRVEMAEAWARREGVLAPDDRITIHGTRFADRLAAALLHIRCTRSDYPRAAISLEPIVRCEQSLTASFRDRRCLRSAFLRSTVL